jgi:hypothetical protein
VREAAAEIAPALRGRPLAAHRALLTELIGSPALKPALPQLLLTLETAPDRVDELVFALAERFLATNTEALDSVATAGAGHSKQLAELVLRAYAQAPNPPARGARARSDRPADGTTRLRDRRRRRQRRAIAPEHDRLAALGLPRPGWDRNRQAGGNRRDALPARPRFPYLLVASRSSREPQTPAVDDTQLPAGARSARYPLSLPWARSSAGRHQEHLDFVPVLAQ